MFLTHLRPFLLLHLWITFWQLQGRVYYLLMWLKRFRGIYHAYKTVVPVYLINLFWNNSCFYFTPIKEFYRTIILYYLQQIFFSPFLYQNLWLLILKLGSRVSALGAIMVLQRRWHSYKSVGKVAHRQTPDPLQAMASLNHKSLLYHSSGSDKRKITAFQVERHSLLMKRQANQRQNEGLIKVNSSEYGRITGNFYRWDFTDALVLSNINNKKLAFCLIQNGRSKR